jgi:2-polyprenyl-3-methyl-5-hydroxy-6-metoxy-1,4-benzoquinol methylase
VKASDAVSCPACGTLSRVGSGFIARCTACGHRWLNRTERDHAAVEAGTFTGDYAGYRADPTYVSVVTAIIRDELVERVPPPARLLDVGCGAGDFMAAAQTFGYSVEGIDISEASARICTSRGLDCVAGDLLSHEFADDFDIVVMWDVIAHLRSPAEFVSRVRELLSKDGILLIKTPVMGDLSVEIARAMPRMAGALLGAPSHTQYFDRESLTALFRRNALEPEWINGSGARSRGSGGSLKRRLARRFREVIGRISGDSNSYVVARFAS